MKKMLGCLMIISLLCALKPAQSAPITYTGNLELRSPIWASEDRLVTDPFPRFVDFEPNIRYLDLAGNIRFAQEGSPLAAWVSGEHSFNRGYFFHENELRVGLDLLVSKNTSSPVTLFSFWERKFDLDVNRVFVGARLGFSGELD